MSEIYSILCPYCDQKYKIKSSYIGKKTKCKKCEKMFAIGSRTDQNRLEFNVDDVLGPTEKLSLDRMKQKLELPEETDGIPVGLPIDGSGKPMKPKSGPSRNLPVRMHKMIWSSLPEDSPQVDPFR